MERTATTWTREHMPEHLRGATAELDVIDKTFTAQGKLPAMYIRWLIDHFRYQLGVITDLTAPDTTAAPMP